MFPFPIMKSSRDACHVLGLLKAAEQLFSSLFTILDLVCVSLAWMCVAVFFAFLRDIHTDQADEQTWSSESHTISAGGFLLFFHTMKMLKFLRQSEKLAIITNLIFNIIQDLGPIAFVYLVLISGCAFAVSLPPSQIL